MALNPSPEVAVARDAARRLGADRCVVIYTTAGGHYGYASFGRDRRLCASARAMGETVWDALHDFLEREAISST